MAVASYDAQFSFQQDSLARLGDRGVSGKLSEEQLKKFNESPAMIAARKADELALQYTHARDNQRMITDTFFRAEDSDWSAPRAFDYRRAVDYYHVLGVEEYATLEEVKAAYKKLSLIYHPDKTKGLHPEQQAEYAAVFISVKNAHLVLSDKPTRRQYDYDRDHDRAKAEVQGTAVQSQENQLDLKEVLERIKEMQRPPGQNIEVSALCKLEKFFYGGKKELRRKRTVKDFYKGLVTEEHTLRVLIPRGAPEPLASVFKEQGDWHAETKPDTITVRLCSKPHPYVERHGADILAREELLLAEGPCLEAQAPYLRGRHVLLLGRSPLYGAAPGTALELRLRGEGLGRTGALRLRCRLGDEAAGAAAPPAREAARSLLRGALEAVAAWRAEGAPGGAEGLLCRMGAGLGPRAAQRRLSAALRAVEGEWGLVAAVNAAMAHGEGRHPDLGDFLHRHDLGAPSGGGPPGGGGVGGGAEAPWPSPAAGCRHGEGGLCGVPALRRRAERVGPCEAELTPLGPPVALFTAPTCSVAFYSNAEPLEGPRERLEPHSLFALCLSSPACARAKAQEQWEALRAQLAPLLQATALLLLPAARRALPLALADFACPASAGPLLARPEPPIPWKRLGDEALRRGDTYEALGHYARCLEAARADRVEGNAEELSARVLCNRALCLISVGEPESALAEAREAQDLRPAWSRPWARAGAALEALGEGRWEEALQARFKAAELEPSAANAEALLAAARAARSASAEAASTECELGSRELRARRLGAAAAHYTLALALVPLEEGEAELWLRAVLHSNRAAARCRLRAWEAAVADGRAAVAAAPTWHRAHNRLGAALLGAGQPEQAYTEFAWALMIDNGNELARRGQEACLCALPLWRSRPSRARLEARFGADLGRPRGATRVFALSDLHFDHRPNEEWVHRLDELEFQEDVLIVAGNIANTHYTATRALRTLKSKFRRVFYVPGNEDVWMNPGEVHNSRFPDSFSKLLALLETCDELGVDVFPAAICHDVFVVPLFSWYNAQFDKKSRPDPTYAPDETCVWPMDAKEQLWKYMLKLNEAHLGRAYRGTVITFSHFLPLAALPFSSDGNIRAAQSMGCEDIEDQIRGVRSAAHVYGHSALQAVEQHGGVMFVNHFHGWAEEGAVPGPPPPLCIFDGARGGLAVSDGRGRAEAPQEGGRF